MNVNSNRANGAFTAIKKGYREFCEHTPIHGVQYTGQGRRKRLERALWVGILLVAASCCSYLIYKSHKKWVEAPVLVNFKTELVNVWEIPFPAVTICPGYLTFNAESYKDYCLTESSRLLMKLICAFGENSDGKVPNKNANCNYSALFKEALETLTPNDRQFLLRFMDNETLLSYDTLVTEFGLCYTFNLLDAEDIFKEEVVVESLIVRKSNSTRKTNWKLSKGYEDLNMTYPYRVFGAGVQDGLLGIFIQNPTIPQESCKSSSVDGYSIILHSPMEYPSSDKEVITGPANRSIIVYVKPKAIYASEDIESIPIAKRRCYFEHESNLRFFKYYTETNCQLECLSNYTYKICNCVPPHLPRSADMSLCQTIKNIQCSREAPESLVEIEFENRNKPESSCNCIANCNELTYESETVHSPLNGTSREPDSAMFSSIICISFWESEFWPATRLRFHSLPEFLADCGGLMGLCMGVSFVSLIEILYHCSLRHFMIRKKSHEGKISEEQAEEVELTLL